VFIFANADRNLGIQAIVDFLQNEPKVPSKYDIGEDALKRDEYLTQVKVGQLFTVVLAILMDVRWSVPAEEHLVKIK
jgi:hypothetical protein